MPGDRAPSGLGKAGKALWRRITSVYDLDPREYASLEACCRQADAVALLEEDAIGAPATVRGSQGQEVTHPSITEARLGRASLVRMLGTLRLPSEDDARPWSARSERASRAAQSRWQRTPSRRGRGVS